MRHDGLVSYDFERLAEAIIAAREAKTWTQDDLVRESALGRSTIQRLESGKQTAYPSRATIQALERTLGWAPGSVRSILGGGEPTYLGDEASTDDPADTWLASLRDRLPLRVVHQLEDGSIYDTLTYDLTPDGGARVISVVIVDHGADPELTDPVQRAKIGRAWSIEQRRLLGLPKLKWEPGDPPEDKPSPEGH